MGHVSDYRLANFRALPRETLIRDAVADCARYVTAWGADRDELRYAVADYKTVFLERGWHSEWAAVVKEARAAADLAIEAARRANRSTVTGEGA